VLGPFIPEPVLLEAASLRFNSVIEFNVAHLVNVDLILLGVLMDNFRCMSITLING